MNNIDIVVFYCVTNKINIRSWYNNIQFQYIVDITRWLRTY